jgi:ornithine cyclodeaminase/alanine dehydrogenase-like protein (mu-crystallin family)
LFADKNGRLKDEYTYEGLHLKPEAYVIWVDYLKKDEIPIICLIMNRTKVAILGAGFISDIHLESYHRFIPEAEVVAVYARNPDKAKAFAEKFHILHSGSAM